jgi:hypothetical protein
MSEKYREKTLKRMDVQLTGENIPATEEEVIAASQDGVNIKSGAKGRQADSKTLVHGAHTDNERPERTE